MKRIIVATGLLAASVSGAAAGTLDTVKQRGTLVCGVSTGFAGFSAPDSQGQLQGTRRRLLPGAGGRGSRRRRQGALCRAHRAKTGSPRCSRARSNVLYRNSTQTYLRGVTLGLRQGPVNFYDGQGFVVRPR